MKLLIDLDRCPIEVVFFFPRVCQPLFPKQALSVEQTLKTLFCETKDANPLCGRLTAMMQTYLLFGHVAHDVAYIKSSVPQPSY